MQVQFLVREKNTLKEIANENSVKFLQKRARRQQQSAQLSVQAISSDSDVDAAQQQQNYCQNMFA